MKWKEEGNTVEFVESSKLLHSSLESFSFLFEKLDETPMREEARKPAKIFQNKYRRVPSSRKDSPADSISNNWPAFGNPNPIELSSISHRALTFFSSNFDISGSSIRIFDIPFSRTISSTLYKTVTFESLEESSSLFFPPSWGEEMTLDRTRKNDRKFQTGKVLCRNV